MKVTRVIEVILAVASVLFVIVAILTVWENARATVDDIDSTISQMSLDEKVGQVIIAGLPGLYADEVAKEAVLKYHIGGVNLLSRNIKDRAQVAKLTKDLQASAAVPLFVAVDQEGGIISRLKFLKELTPQYCIRTTAQARRIALARGKELKELGVNINFSPVLDYVTSSKSYLWPRVFRGNVAALSRLGSAMAVGYKEAGIIAVPKHFPGYGNIRPDPHSNTAVLLTNVKGLATSLVPFGSILRGGADAVMTAHVSAPFFDAKPATVSSKFITQLLRGVWDFSGVVFTDDIEMASAGQSVGETAVEAIKAGADVVIVSITPEKYKIVFESLKSAVLKGNITEQRLNESVGRILKLKQAYKISK